jgi:hypothetical protein
MTKKLNWSEDQYNIVIEKSDIRQHALELARLRLVDGLPIMEISKSKKVSRTLVQRAVKGVEDFMEEHLKSSGLEFKRVIVAIESTKIED